MKIKRESLSKKILFYLKDTSKDFLDLSVRIIFDPRSITKGMSLYRNNIQYFSKEVSYFKNSSYFNFKDNKFYLTEKGRTNIIKNIIKDKKTKNKKWDKKWRMIIFDIPELSSRERRFLRLELKWMGFKELQKSAWIFPYDVEKELLALLKLWKMDFEGDIRFLKIEKMIEEGDIKKYFKIK